MPLMSRSRKQPPLAWCSGRWLGVAPCLLFAFIGVVAAEGGGGEVGAVRWRRRVVRESECRWCGGYVDPYIIHNVCMDLQRACNVGRRRRMSGWYWGLDAG